ncbi:MAG: TetR/AcrR family transcriptional regulator [Solirubrobacterales bacterium]
MTLEPQDAGAPRRRLPAAERRKLILSAAIDAFADRGYHETSLDEVGRRAGVSKALIYEHFTSKQELYGELLETYVHELLERVGSAAISAEEGGEARLLAGLEGFLEFVDERRDAWRMLIRNRASDDVDDLFERLFDEVAAMVSSLLAVEMPASVLPEGADFDMVVEATSRQLLGAITSMANWWDEHREVPRSQVLAMIMEFAWVGLERAAEGERWAPGSEVEARPR